MARVRSIIVLSLLAVWIATAALACLPNPHMTQVEMTCCKKMAGNCNMGTGQHPCCKTTVNRPSLEATLQRAGHIQPPIAACSMSATDAVQPSVERFPRDTNLGPSPPAPPGLHSILRI